jgi:hypothetical protein
LDKAQAVLMATNDLGERVDAALTCEPSKLGIGLSAGCHAEIVRW